MISRRKFVRNAAMVAGSLAYQKSFGKTTHSEGKPKVIILGAGLAGLSAAWELKQTQVPFVLLEARNRIAGRVLSMSVDSAPKLTVELGGEWISNSHKKVLDLCSQFKLPLIDHQPATHLVYKGKYTTAGKWNYSNGWNERFDTLLQNFSQWSEADKKLLDQYDWWRYLVNNGCEGRDLDIRELLDSTDFGEAIRNVSALATINTYAGSNNGHDKKIAGGNNLLAEKLADAVGRENILLEHAVASVSQTADGVTVKCYNGASFAAERLVCTLPTFSLARVNWSPALPAEKIAAINALQYARVNKRPILFSNRFWKEENFDLVSDTPAHYFYHATKYQPGEKGILISQSIGDKAAVIANQSDTINEGYIFEALRPGFGDIRGLMEKQWNYYWGNDAYTRGAYALYKPGQLVNIKPVLQASYLNTFFAGEHLAEKPGTMEGALQSGADAVLKIPG